MAVPTIAEIEEIITAKSLAVERSELVESIKCTAAVVNGDRYKLTFSDYSTGGNGHG